MVGQTRIGQVIVAWLFFVLFVLPSANAQAAPTAHILRIDPRTSVENDNPVVTAVVDLTQTRRISDVVANCVTLRGDEQLDCMSEALEQPGSLATSHPFPADHVSLSVRIGDSESAATYLSHSSFGEAQGEAGAGTAWLVVVDADARMSAAFDDAQKVARRFVEAMGPSDLVDVVFLSDQQVVSDTHWLDAAHSKSALSAIDKQKGTVRSQGRTRPLLSQLKQTARDAFTSLGSSDSNASPPLHQAMVVIASGYGGGDPATTGPGAAQLSEFLTRGRLSEDNTALPRLPLPIVSIYVPPKGMAEHKQLAKDFMLGLANPDIGGFFTILRDGQADHAGRIVDAVRSRFAQMILARFKLSCLAPTSTQSFALLFPGSSPQIVGDSSFKDVPLGVDPRDWPLDLDVELTRRTARNKGGVYPGGTVKVFGNFCWGGDTTRPEIYFLPPGERLPQDLTSSPNQAREVQKRLTSLDLRGKTLQAGQAFAEFSVPVSDQLLHGEGDTAVMRLVVIDAKLHRSSGLAESTVLQLAGTQPPIPALWYWLGGGAGLLITLLLTLIIVGTRNRNRKQSATNTPRPRVTESPYATPAAVTRAPRSDSAVGTRATIEGPAGHFTVLAGNALRVGRDGTRCAAVLASAQISGLHATFRFEQGKLMVRDEGSTAGTRVGDQNVPSGRWIEVADGAEVFLGPEMLRVSFHRTGG